MKLNVCAVKVVKVNAAACALHAHALTVSATLCSNASFLLFDQPANYGILPVQLGLPIPQRVKLHRTAALQIPRQVLQHMPSQRSIQQLTAWD